MLPPSTRTSPNGAVWRRGLLAALAAGLTRCVSGEPTSRIVKVRGIKTTKNLKAGQRVTHSFVHLSSSCEVWASRASIDALVAGKTIARIPKTGGLFAPEQLPQSKSWPALKFMKEQVQLIWCSLISNALVSCASSLVKPSECCVVMDLHVRFGFAQGIFCLRGFALSS